ncbi:uncharacterized protein LOC143938994 isoform X1 [Lithobates pipiens]
MKETHQRVKKPLRQQDMDIRHFVSKKGSNAAEGAEPESHDEAVSTDQLSECDDSILLAEEGTSSTTTDTEVFIVPLLLPNRIQDTIQRWNIGQNVCKISSLGIWDCPGSLPSVLVSDLENFSGEAHCRHTEHRLWSRHEQEFIHHTR